MSNQEKTTTNDDETKIHGIVVFKNLRYSSLGMNKSIMMAQPYMKRYGIELLFISSGYISFWFSLFKIIRKGHIKYNFVIFNSLASFVRPISFILAYGLKIFRIPVFIYWHETDWALQKFLENRPLAMNLLRSIASSDSTVNLVVSDACAKSIKNFFPKALPVKIYNCATVPNYVENLNISIEQPIVINIASIQPRKGTDLFVETAIKVCQQHSQVKFIWLGSGDNYGTWRKEIDDAELKDRIIFPGYINEPHLWLRHASIFFLSSRDDPFPLSVLEAMCLKRTIVTFDVGGAPEALDGNGILIKPFDTNAAAKAILKCFECNYEKLINQEVKNQYDNAYTPAQFAKRFNRQLRNFLE